MKEELFFYGGIDKDNVLLQEGDYIDASCCLNLNAESDKKGSITNIKGNTLYQHGYTIPSGTNKVIKTCQDEENNAIIYFVYNSEDYHHILRFYVDTKTFEKVLFAPSGTLSVLNFQENPEVFDADVIDGQLYWTDNYNPPRKINIQKAVNYSTSASVDDIDKYTSITSALLDRIKAPPYYRPFVRVITDTSYNRNNLRGGMFQFAYRYIYEDNQRSVLSPISKVPLAQYDELINGKWAQSINTNNAIEYRVNTGAENVEKIEVYVREGNLIPDTTSVTGGFYLIETIDKYVDGDQVISDSTIYLGFFYNDVARYRGDQNDLMRPYDYVPILSGAQTLIDGNKLVDFNYLEGYDKIHGENQIYWSSETLTMKRSSVPISFSYVLWAQYYDTIYDDGGGKKRYNFYYYAIITLPEVYNPDPIDIFSMYVSDGTHSGTINVPVGATYPSSLKANIEGALMAMSITSPTLYKKPEHDVDNVVTLFPTYIASIKFLYQRPYSSGQEAADALGWEISDITLESFNNYKYPVFKTGSKHQFGIVYKDSAKRSCAIIKDDLKLDIPWRGEIFDIPNPYLNLTNDYKIFYPKIYISNLAPEWARFWSVVWFKDIDITWSEQYIYRMNSLAGGSWENDVRKDAYGNLRIRINKPIEEHRSNIPKTKLQNYTWSEGDRIRFYGVFNQSDQIGALDDSLDFTIIGAEEYNDVEISGSSTIDHILYEIIIEDFTPEDYGLFKTLTSTWDRDGVLFEIYTPALDVENKIAYEIGEDHPIVNREHYIREITDETDGVMFGSPQSGNTPAELILKHPVSTGNMYVRNRLWSIQLGTSSSVTLPVETRSFSDFYSSDVHSIGFIQVDSDVYKQKRFKSGIRYSNPLVQDTQINGLNTVEYDNYHILNENYGTIIKGKQVGDALKIRQERKSTSFYIGKSFLKTAQGNDVPVEAEDRVLGSKVVSNESYGLQDQFAYTNFGRHEYFYDVINGVVVRDSANGMFPISSYGMESYFKAKSKQILENRANYKIISGYDVENDLYILTIIDLLVPVNSETYAFHEKSNKWKCSLPHYGITGYDLITGRPIYASAEQYGWYGQYFVSFLNGELWLHNSNTLRNNFYGTQHDQWIKFRSQVDPDKIKVWRSMGINSNVRWGSPDAGDIYIPPTVTYPRGMSSRLKSGRFEHREGVLYADYLNNMLTTSSSALTDDLLNGESLRGRTMDQKITNSETGETDLFSVIINVTPSEYSK